MWWIDLLLAAGGGLLCVLVGVVVGRAMRRPPPPTTADLTENEQYIVEAYRKILDVVRNPDSPWGLCSEGDVVSGKVRLTRDAPIENTATDFEAPKPTAIETVDMALRTDEHGRVLPQRVISKKPILDRIAGPAPKAADYANEMADVMRKANGDAQPPHDQPPHFAEAATAYSSAYVAVLEALPADDVLTTGLELAMNVWLRQYREMGYPALPQEYRDVLARDMARHARAWMEATHPILKFFAHPDCYGVMPCGSRGEWRSGHTKDGRGLWCHEAGTPAEACAKANAQMARQSLTPDQLVAVRQTGEAFKAKGKQ